MTSASTASLTGADGQPTRARSALVLDREAIKAAQAYAKTAAETYCNVVGAEILAAPCDGIAMADAVQLGLRAAAAGPEAACEMIGKAYTSRLPAEERSAGGVFFTPPQIVSYLLDMAEAAGVDWDKSSALDPAAGAGAFLVAAALRMAGRLPHRPASQVLDQVVQRLRGYEIEPFSAWLAQAMLAGALAPWSRDAGQPVPAMVDVRDSLDLRDEDLGRYDLVMGNPPFGRVRLSADRRAKYSRGVHGHANLYGLFTDAAIRWTAPGGLVAYVTPTSMLSGLYFKSLRSLMATEAPPVAVALVADRAGVFEGVLQETMLTLSRRGGSEPEGGRRVSFLTVRSGRALAADGAGTFELPKTTTSPWLLPRAPEDAELTRRMRSMPHRLADYGYGVSTRPLVWNRHKLQLVAAHQAGLLPVVWAEAVTADGRFEWRAERRNHAPWFEPRLPRDQWLLADKPCVLLQRTTGKEQMRRLIAAEMPASFVKAHGAVVIENHLNMIRPIRQAPEISLAAVAALLNSGAADLAFRCISGSVAVSAYELESMPVPPPALMLRVTTIFEQGGGAARAEALIAKAYGVATPRERRDHAAAAA